MIERLSQELQSLLGDDKEGPDRDETLRLLRARLALCVTEGLVQASGVDGRAEPLAPAQIAAFLDGTLPPDEWQAVADRLADDQALRADLESAAMLLDQLDTPPPAMPAGLLARAADVLATSHQVQNSRLTSVRWLAAMWWRRPAAWSGLAALVLVAVLAPAVVATLVREPHEAPTEPKAASPVRSLATPSEKKTVPEPRSCDDRGQTRTTGARKPEAPAASAHHPAESSPATRNDDPCPPAQSGSGAER
jgi:hypothetical protein